MSNQIFKKLVPNEILYDLLDKEAIKTNKYYLLNKIVFKKCEYNNLLEEWCQNLKPYYYSSKQYYLTRKLTYPRFITVVRQICKYNHISFTSQIKYDKSQYDINFYIYY